MHNAQVCAVVTLRFLTTRLHEYFFKEFADGDVNISNSLHRVASQPENKQNKLVHQPTRKKQVLLLTKRTRVTKVTTIPLAEHNIPRRQNSLNAAKIIPCTY